jgi:hypothetical protein
VEVKKPEEPVSTVQMAEIAFLNQMGLHARVLRFVVIKYTKPMIFRYYVMLL